MTDFNTCNPLRLVLAVRRAAPLWYPLLMLNAVCAGLTVPATIYLQAQIINTACHGNGAFPAALAALLSAYFLLYCYDSAASAINEYCSSKIQPRLTRLFTLQLLDTVSETAYSQLEKDGVRNIIKRIDDKQLYALFLAETILPRTVRCLLELGGIFWFIAASGVWWAFPLAITAALPSFYFNRKRIEAMRRIYIDSGNELRYTDYLNEVLLDRNHAIERRFFGFCNRIGALWKTKRQSFERRKALAFIKSWLATGTAMCFSMSAIPLTGYALLQPLQSGTLSIGLFAAILLAVANNMNSAINSLAGQYALLHDTRYFCHDLRELASLGKTGTAACPGAALPRFESLTFENVWFRYPGQADFVLRGVSFTIRSNERLALAGINGSGKTTITRLMLGLYRPTSGRILLNGTDTAACSERELASLFALMPQNFSRYKDSLATNVTLYEPRRSASNLQKALDDSGAATIAAKHNGAAVIISAELQDGINLSGGEWQKVALARVLHSGRSFIIFDEPTAALDPLAEVRFYENCGTITNNRTCLFITHRLGSIRLFDSCLVLAGGKIAESGPHEKLMENNGIYRKLYNSQKRWYQEKEVCRKDDQDTCRTLA